jgi:membrane-associated progesterone receptor component
LFNRDKQGTKKE